MKVVRGIIVAFLSSAVVVGALEFVARVVYVAETPARVRTYVPADPTLRPLESFSDLDHHNQRGIYKGLLYETNRLRLRSPERPLARPPGTTRIVLLGDSFVMGDGVLAEESYAWLLEGELPRIRAGRYETINTGISGLDAAHAVMRYERLGLVYDPNIAIYGFTINDLEGPHYEKTMTPAPHRYNVEDSPFFFWRIVGPGYVAIRERLFPPDNSYVAELRHNSREEAAAWKDFLSVLDQLMKIGEERGICNVLFVHTQLVTLNSIHPFRDLYDRVAEAARDRGFLAIQSLPVFLGRDDKSLWVNPFDSHPNPEGHRLLAKALAEGILSLPSNCWALSERPNGEGLVAR